MSGRHSRGWWAGLVTAVKRYYGFPTGVPQRIAASTEVGHSRPAECLPCSRQAPVRRRLRPPPPPPGPVRRARYLAESPMYIAVSAALGMDQLLGVAA